MKDEEEHFRRALNPEFGNQERLARGDQQQTVIKGGDVRFCRKGTNEHLRRADQRDRRNVNME